MDESRRVPLIIEAGKTERHYWKDMWRYRELFYFLAWRDILVRYKQTTIGIAWAWIRPLLTMIVFTIVFGKLAALPSGPVPYPILVLGGILPWQFFSTAFSEAGNSVVANANMISKVYFPRLIVPTSSVIVSLADLFISGVILALVMIWYGQTPDWKIVALPVFVILGFLAALGAGLWVAALTVKYRDFRHITPFIVQLGLYVSPVGFSSAVVPERWRLLYSMNPMVGVIDGFRWTLLNDAAALYWPSLLTSLMVSAALLITGIQYFRTTERTFADVI